MDYTQGSAVAAQFRQACTDFDIKDKRRIRSIIGTLDLTAQYLARSDIIRIEAGADLKLWTDLRKLWRDLTRTQLSFWENDDSDEEDEENEEIDSGGGLRAMCTCLAKFTRNLVAGVPGNQLRAYENEPDMRRLLHFYTSWSAMEDSESVATARVLTQALSNTVTANDALVARLWETYMNLPEDQVVLIRLLGSPDARTLLTTLIFILNCIHGSRKRTQLLVKTKVGVRICIGLLDNMVNLHEADEGSEGAKAFDIGYAIFTQFIEEGFVPDLYKKFTITNEIVTPHQTTLLKLVDSYLQATQLNPTSIQIPDILRTHESLGSFLAKRFFTLSEYAQKAMHRALGMVPTSKKAESSEDSVTGRTSSDSTSSSGKSGSPSPSSSSVPSAPPQELDVMLPKVCEALVLVTQCIVTICLEAEEQQTRLEEGISTYVSFTNMKSYFIQKKHSEQGVVENLIELLHLFDVFLPRIQFGKPVNPDGTPMTAASSVAADGSGFSYLKRDLVRLLGVLSHGMKDVQDRTREAGGLPVVMNLCVIDERNPYLREHAVFTLHNLLKSNPENQKFVDSIKPSQEWDEDGTLKTKVGATLK
ncbi:spinocerebellar ataxia type 10 protein domain-containing protein [Flammula alnicola]|nr:spinocerebellar ataxia type 10 protein domain-containing protein [Flammula alnicola]